MSILSFILVIPALVKCWEIKFEIFKMQFGNFYLITMTRGLFVFSFLISICSKLNYFGLLLRSNILQGGTFPNFRRRPLPLLVTALGVRSIEAKSKKLKVRNKEWIDISVTYMTIDKRSEQNLKILRHLGNFSDTQVFGKFTKYFKYHSML